MQTIVLRDQTHANWVYISSIQTIIGRDEGVSRLWSMAASALLLLSACAFHGPTAMPRLHLLSVAAFELQLWWDTYNTAHVTCKGENIYYLVLHRTNVLTPTGASGCLPGNHTVWSLHKCISGCRLTPCGLSPIHSILDDQLPLNDSFGVSG